MSISFLENKAGSIPCLFQPPTPSATDNNLSDVYHASSPPESFFIGEGIFLYTDQNVNFDSFLIKFNKNIIFIIIILNIVKMPLFYIFNIFHLEVLQELFISKFPSFMALNHFLYCPNILLEILLMIFILMFLKLILIFILSFHRFYRVYHQMALFYSYIQNIYNNNNLYF